MAEGAISLPPGAFAAAKAGTPQPVAPKADAPAPDVKLRKAPELKKEPEIVHKPTLREAEPEKAEEPAGMTPTERKIWKLKADGEEFEFDATDEEAVKREIMKARGANKRFQSAAEMRKDAEQAFQMLKDPQQLRKILQDPRIGIDLKKFAEDFVWEQIQEQQMTPEQKAQRDKDRELAEYKARDAQAREEGLTRQQQEAQGRYEATYEARFLKALEKNPAIPVTPQSVARMAELTMLAVDNNIDLTDDEIASVYLQELDSNDKARLNKATPEQLARMLGEEGLKRLRDWDLARLRNPQGNPFPSRSPAKKAAERKTSPTETRKPGSEWRDGLMKDFLNRNR